MKILVTGATGFIGGRVTRQLLADGHDVRALVRNPDRARGITSARLHRGDLLDADSLAGAGDQIDVAYYLVHSMGRGGDRNFEEREQRGGDNLPAIASREGVPQVVYLGGLGDQPRSAHLRSRQK